MLRQRIVTAVVLLAVLLPALIASRVEPLGVMTLLICAVAAWEWGRLNAQSFKSSCALALLCALLCALTWFYQDSWRPGFGYWCGASVLWVLLGVRLLRRGPGGWQTLNPKLRVLGGVWVIYTTWLAVFQAKGLGSNFLFSTLALVWLADIGAYFSGRALGRHKLAPTISPGKSWEGVLGGFISVVVLSYAWTTFDRWSDANWGWQGSNSLFTVLAEHGLGLQAGALIFTVAMSVVGDLVESLVKRSTNAKDSSHLLPGHGGVLDRIDALLPTLPIAMMWGTM
jgi:phosphatidate cytidylyltransferase